MDTTLLSIFYGGSRTYFYSTLFFPRDIRRDVFILYSFVRVADDYVDAIPQETEAFYSFVDTYQRAASGEITGDVVIDGFADLALRLSFEPKWLMPSSDPWRWILPSASMKQRRISSGTCTDHPRLSA